MNMHMPVTTNNRGSDTICQYSSNNTRTSTACGIGTCTWYTGRCIGVITAWVTEYVRVSAYNSTNTSHPQYMIDADNSECI
jgi:hypothetical protein